MKQARLLRLYGDLMDLYGDRGNLTALTYRLGQLGVPFTVEERGVFDTLDFGAYDLVYVGPGKDRNLLRAAEHLAGYADGLRAAVEADTVFLATGSAQLLFGRSITDETGAEHPAAGLFDYTGVLTGEVFIDDAVLEPVFLPDEPAYGFINRTSRMVGGGDMPLFRVRYAEKPIGDAEGILYRNFLGTWALGPLLAKNPALLKNVLERLLGEPVTFDDARQREALRRTLAELPG